MKEEFSKYDKVVYDGEVFEVLETADNTGIMKIEPLFDETYKFIWVDEEMVVSLSRAIKLRLIDDETADEAMNSGSQNRRRGGGKRTACRERRQRQGRPGRRQASVGSPSFG